MDKTILTAGPSISEKEIEYVLDAVKHGWNFELDKYLRKFEEKFARYIGVKHAIATSSCTGALHLSLSALGIGENDEVIVPETTWVATASSVTFTKARPVFADVEEDIWCIDPKVIRELITKKTKAIMPVHLYGNPARMDEINKIAREYNLYVIEDAAPAIGAEYRGRKVGSLSDAATFSFQGAKMMVTGEGGMFVTDSDKIYERAKFLFGQGRDAKRKFWINELWCKYNMSNLQAALGLAQLERLPEFIESKRRIFNWYKSRLGDIEGLSMNIEREDVKNNFWMSSIVLKKDFAVTRDELMAKLKERKIDTRPFFPPISHFSMFEKMNSPVASMLYECGMNLPSGVMLTEEEVDWVAKNVREILGV